MGMGGAPLSGMPTILVGGTTGDATGSVSGLVVDPASRKRGRETSEGLGFGDSGNQHPFMCTECRASFSNEKSLFSHMRAHHNHPWKGAYAPPIFTWDEFADMGLLNLEEGQAEQQVEQVAQETTLAVVGVQQARNQSIEQPQTLEGQVQYSLPDLNRSPSEEGNGNGNGNN